MNKRIIGGILMLALLSSNIPQVVEAFEDNTAPQITSISITPTEVNTSEQDQTVTVTVAVADSGVGICLDSNACERNESFLSLVVTPLIGTSTQNLDIQSWEYVSGDINNGIYQAVETLPHGSKVGIWEIGGSYSMPIQIYDDIGNRKIYTTESYYYDTYGYEALENIPSLTRTFVNTASSDSVVIESEWTLESTKAEATFPAGTIVSRKEGGSYEFYRMVSQDVSVQDLTSYSTINYYASDGVTILYTEYIPNLIGAFKLGIPGLNLSFSKPVTVKWKVGSTYNGYNLNINSLSEDGTAWANETSCLVSNGNCTFTVNHATYFSVTKQKRGSIKLETNKLPATTRKSSVTITGKTAGRALVKIYVNKQLKKIFKASSTGSFVKTVNLSRGNNNISIAASKSTNLKTLNKKVKRT